MVYIIFVVFVIRVEFFFTLYKQVRHVLFRANMARLIYFPLERYFNQENIFSVRPNYTHPNLKMPVAPNFHLTLESCWVSNYCWDAETKPNEVNCTRPFICQNVLLDYCKIVITMCMILVNRNLQSHKCLKMVTWKSKFTLNMHFFKSKHVMT